MNLDNIIAKVADWSVPASLVHFGAAVANIVAMAKADLGAREISFVEAVVQLSGAASTLIGSFGVVLSIYLSFQWRRKNAEMDHEREMRELDRDHDFRMAKLSNDPPSRIPRDFPFDSSRTAKPDDDTVDLK
ncbi:hypothetical protein GC170_14515 [bacterium]|nr:hypothetical protein [bacterium]